MDENSDMKMALDEARYSLQQQFQGAQVIRDSAKTILGAASLVISVGGSIQTLRPQVASDVNTFNAVLVISLVLFGLVIAGCLCVILPLKMKTPIRSLWSEYQDAFFGKEERELLKQNISSHLNVVELNGPVLDKAAIIVRWSGAGFILTVIGMIGLTVIR